MTAGRPPGAASSCYVLDGKVGRWPRSRPSRTVAGRRTGRLSEVVRSLRISSRACNVSTTWRVARRSAPIDEDAHKIAGDLQRAIPAHPLMVWSHSILAFLRAISAMTSNGSRLNGRAGVVRGLGSGWDGGGRVCLAARSSTVSDRVVTRSPLQKLSPRWEIRPFRSCLLPVTAPQTAQTSR